MIALAAIEVLARLRGHPGESTPYTEAADAWVASTQVKPYAELVGQAVAVISRITGPDSELNELWEESDEYGAWRASVADLLSRVGA